MWSINHEPEPVCNWLDFEPVRILYEYDGPMIFTCRGGLGNYFLAFQAGQSREVVRFLVIPFSEPLEARLVTGDINLRDALSHSRMWVFDLNQKWEPIRCWRVRPDDLPPNVLPKPGVMLSAHLAPVMGDSLRPAASESVYVLRDLPKLISAGGPV